MQCSRQCMCWLNGISLRPMSFVHFHSKCLLLYWSCCSSFSLGQAEHSSWQTQSVLGSWWRLAFEPSWVLGHKHQLTWAGLNRYKCTNKLRCSSWGRPAHAWSVWAGSAVLVQVRKRALGGPVSPRFWIRGLPIWLLGVGSEDYSFKIICTVAWFVGCADQWRHLHRLELRGY